MDSIVIGAPEREVLARELAKARMKEALALVEDAQNKLERACQLMCPVIGFVNEWNAAGRLRDRIKRFWYRVSGRKQRLGEKIRVDDGFVDWWLKEQAGQGRP